MSSISEDVNKTILFTNNSSVDGYGRIYSTSNEDIEDLYSAVDFNGKKVLSVLASGDQAFMAYLNGASKVDLFDINKLTIYYYYIRVWTMKYFGTFYPEPYLCRDFVRALLTHVKPENKMEEDCVLYWKNIIEKLKEYEFLMMFFSKSTIIQLSNDRLNSLKNILANNESKFYNVDISKDNNIEDKYDIVITSNIVDWVSSADGNLSEYKKNISKLLNPKGIVLSSNISHERPNVSERDFFEEDFDYYEIFGSSNNSLNYSPGYMFVKK